MANVLSENKQQQVIALGRLGWSLRRIERETGIRRETAAVYLRAAGVAVRRAGWGRRPPAKPAIQVATDFAARQQANRRLKQPRSVRFAHGGVHAPAPASLTGN